MNRLECRVKNFIKRHKDITKVGNKYTVKKSVYKVLIPKKLTNYHYRFLGILHGDGNMSFRRIHISDKSKIYHERIIHPLFQKAFGIKLHLYHDKNRNSYYSHIKNSIIYRYLVEVLEVPKGAIRYNLLIPSYLKTATIKQKASYLAGIFDAEGYISKRQIEINLSTTSEDLFRFIRAFLKTAGIKYSVYIRNRRKNIEHEIYLYGKENIQKFIKIVKIKHPDKLSRLSLFFPAH